MQATASRPFRPQAPARSPPCAAAGSAHTLIREVPPSRARAPLPRQATIAVLHKPVRAMHDPNHTRRRPTALRNGPRATGIHLRNARPHVLAGSVLTIPPRPGLTKPRLHAVLETSGLRRRRATTRPHPLPTLFLETMLGQPEHAEGDTAHEARTRQHASCTGAQSIRGACLTGPGDARAGTANDAAELAGRARGEKVQLPGVPLKPGGGDGNTYACAEAAPTTNTAATASRIKACEQ